MPPCTDPSPPQAPPRGRPRFRYGEWIAERLIAAVALSTIGVVFLIFLFVARETLPLLLGRTNSALIQEVIPVSEMDRTPPETLRRYLGLSRARWEAMDPAVVRAIMATREEALEEIPAPFRDDPDARINTVGWRYLLLPHAWTGYDRPAFIWQPVGTVSKFNLVPLLAGSLKVTLIGLLFAVPVSLAAALFVSQLAPPRLREWVKPGIELLSAIPSVVMGVFALMVLASLLQRLLGYPYRMNAFVAGIALGLTAVPLIFSIAEDALTAVPGSYAQAALALGASRWDTAWQIVLPAAAPGVLAAVVLGFGRCIGETMVVLMVSGNASQLSWSLFDSTRSMTATIAAEMAEAVSGGPHYQVLFLLGTLLFAVTFLTNLAGALFIQRLRTRLEGAG